MSSSEYEESEEDVAIDAATWGKERLVSQVGVLTYENKSLKQENYKLRLALRTVECKLEVLN